MPSQPTTLDTDSPIACPHCQKKFRLPEGFTSANALACPHCQEKVTGAQILDSVAPTATIIVDESAGDEARSNVPGKRSYLVDEQNFVIPKPLKTATRRRGRSHTPPRKRTSSSIKKPEPKNEIVRIILGGLLALPIAQMILWWMFAMDPIGLAPTVSRYVPFVVPDKLRPADEVDRPVPKRDLDMPPSQKLRDDERVPFNVVPQ